MTEAIHVEVPAPTVGIRSASPILLIEAVSRQGSPLREWIGDDYTIVLPDVRAGDDEPASTSVGAEVVLIHTDRIGTAAERTFTSVLERFPDAAVTVASEVDDESTARAAILLGVHEYLDSSSLSGPALQRAIARSALRRKVERRSRQISAELAEANAELCDFAHIVAHDLRAPVRTAHLFGERLVATVNPELSGSTELAGRLLGCLARLDQTVISMLDYTSVRAELPEPVAVNVGAAARFVAADVCERFSLDPAVVTVDVEGDVIASTSSFHLTKVLDHLLRNAVQYRAESRPLTIEITGRLTAGRVRLGILDNGSGVPADARERVFQPMQRLAPDQGGSGLGLATARRIVTGFEGSIWIEPDRAEGTAVWIDLPAG